MDFMVLFHCAAIRGSQRALTPVTSGLAITQLCGGASPSNTIHSSIHPSVEFSLLLFILCHFCCPPDRVGGFGADPGRLLRFHLRSKRVGAGDKLAFARALTLPPSAG